MTVTAMGCRRRLALVAALLVMACVARASAPAPASAASVICKAAGLVSGLAGKTCTAISEGRRIIKAGGKLLQGHVGAAVNALTTASASPTETGLVLAGVAGAAVTAANYALGQTGRIVSVTTRPRLTAAFTARVYWRIAAIAALLTVPFLLAAAVQAMLHSDVSLLVRAAFGYLPLAMLAVAVTAQLTELLLSATDGMCALVSEAAGAAPGKALTIVGVFSLASKSPFLAVLVGAVTALGAIAVWMELMMRDAAVSIIVVMLPLAFAALVWPARRVWAVRAVEVLVALILSKLVIVTVLTLGGAALTNVSALGFMVGPVLLALAVAAPWSILRLVPMAELAGGVAGRLRGEIEPVVTATAAIAVGHAHDAHEWASATAAAMRREAEGDDGHGATAGSAGQRMPPALGAGNPEPAGSFEDREAPSESAGGDGRPDVATDPAVDPGAGPAVDPGADPGAGPGTGPRTAASSGEEPARDPGPIAGEDNPGYFGPPTDEQPSSAELPPRPWEAPNSGLDLTVGEENGAPPTWHETGEPRADDDEDGERP